MAEYIEREAFLDAIERGKKYQQDADDIAEMLQNFPAADVREVKRGKWIYNEAPVLGNPYGSYRCTACLQAQDHKSNYCPNCGADMREES